MDVSPAVSSTSVLRFSTATKDSAPPPSSSLRDSCEEVVGDFPSPLSCFSSPPDSMSLSASTDEESAKGKRAFSSAEGSSSTAVSSTVFAMRSTIPSE
jgi:hypothetical protein